MKKLNYAFLLMITILLLSACYESKVSLLKSPSSQIDTGLIKSWKSIPNDNDGKTVSLAIWKFSETEYLIAWEEEGESEKVLARGFTSKIGNEKIINLQDIKSLEDDDRKYVFFKYEFNENGNLVVRILSDEYEKLKGKEFKSSREFHNFVQKNIAQEGLFGDKIEFKEANKIGFEIKTS